MTSTLAPTLGEQMLSDPEFDRAIQGVLKIARD